MYPSHKYLFLLYSMSNSKFNRKSGFSSRALDSGADGGGAYREPGRTVKSTCPVGNTAAALSGSKRKSAKSVRTERIYRLI